MQGYYAITGQIVVRDGKYYSSRQVPTFYLHENVQGIVSESHARLIAQDMLLTALTDKQRANVQVHLTAVRI